MNKGKSPAKTNVGQKHALLLCLALYLVLSFLLFDPKLFTGGDNAVYVILAESIVQGKGYKNIYMPEEPPHTLYPPGFALLLAPFVLVFGTNLIVLKLLIVLTGIGALYFMFKLSELIFGAQAKIIVLFFLTIPIFIIYNHWLLSEMPFLFFSLGSLFFCLRSEKSKEFIWGAILFAIYAFFIRTAGISLIIGLALYLLVKRQFRFFAVFVIIFLIFFIPWQIRQASVSTEGSYLEQLLAKNPYQLELGRANLSELAKRIWENFLFYSFTVLPMTLLPIIKASFLLTVFGFIFLALSLVGFLKRIAKFTVLEIYYTPALIVLLIWPNVWSSDRFFLPVLPIFLFYVYEAIFWLSEKIRSRYSAVVLTGIMVILNAYSIFGMARESVVNNTKYLKGNIYAGYTLDWQRYFELIGWIRSNTPQTSIIMARKPEFVYLLSKRKSFVYPFTTNAEDVKQAINRCDYIIYDSFGWTATTQRYLLPILQQQPENYEIIHQTLKPQFYLLQVKHQ